MISGGKNKAPQSKSEITIPTVNPLQAKPVVTPQMTKPRFAPRPESLAESLAGAPRVGPPATGPITSGGGPKIDPKIALQLLRKGV